MAVIIDDNVKAAIEAILKRGNDAIIRRKGNSIIVLETADMTNHYILLAVFRSFQDLIAVLYPVGHGLFEQYMLS